MPSPSLRNATPLLPELAFVVQLLGPGGRNPGELAGRVEHIASGRAERFASQTELVSFLDECAAQAEPHKQTS